MSPVPAWLILKISIPLVSKILMSPDVELSISTDRRLVSIAFSEVPKPVARSATSLPLVLISKLLVSLSLTPPLVEVRVIEDAEEFDVASKPKVISSSADKVRFPVPALKLEP